MRPRKIQLPRAMGLREAGVYYALLLLLVALAAVCAALGRPSYLSAINLINILYQAAPVALMGVAMTVVLITGNFDLSVASVAALAAAVQIGAVDAAGFWPALLLALAAAGAVGLLNGVMVQLVGINAFIVTLGTLTAVRGLVLIVTGGRSLMVQTPAALATMTTFESGRAGPFLTPSCTWRSSRCSSGWCSTSPPSGGALTPSAAMPRRRGSAESA